MKLLNDPRENRELLKKLPNWIVQKWSWQVNDNGWYPSCVDFCVYIKKEEADITNHATKDSKSTKNARSLATSCNSLKKTRQKKILIGSIVLLIEEFLYSVLMIFLLLLLLILMGQIVNQPC